jgi:membrane-bound lytic murein transglycosylase B
LIEDAGCGSFKLSDDKRIVSMKKGMCLFLAASMLVPGVGFAKQSWSAWKGELRREAVGQGISPKLFDSIFRNMQPSKRQVRLQKTQPEKRLTYMQYRKSRISAYRIKIGRSKYKKYHKVMNQIAEQYGADPCVITATWGVETAYGGYKGNFPVIKSLASLAYDGRRTAFFRTELLHALHIVNDGHISVKDFKGEWAGGSGHAQFLPSSWRKYAVDYTGDGKKDIWNNKLDAFASIANYYHMNGWEPGEPWGVQVQIPSNIPKSMINGYKVKKPMNTWLSMGVKVARGWQLPHENYPAYLVRPHGGPEYMVFPNFRVIMRYNNSTFYALSVSYLADKICQRR